MNDVFCKNEKDRMALSMGVWEDSLSMLEAHGYRISYDPLKKTAKIMAV